MDLNELFNGIAVEIRGSLNQTQQKHQNLAKGEDREGVIIEEFFEKHLPARFGISRGEIADVEGEHSKQMDIIIYDDLNAPVLYEEQAGIIVLNEVVFSVFEAKSNLNRKELNDSFVKTQSAKQLKKQAFISGHPLHPPYDLYGKRFDCFPTLGGVIAFDSMALKSLTEELVLLDLDVDRSERIDSILILDKGVITNYDPVIKQYKFIPGPSTKRVYINTEQKGSALLFFYLLFFSYLNQARLTKPLDLTQYIQKIDISKAETLGVNSDVGY